MLRSDERIVGFGNCQTARGDYQDIGEEMGYLICWYGKREGRVRHGHGWSGAHVIACMESHAQSTAYSSYT